MKNLRQKFERFCFRNRSKGIPNLMLYLCIGSAVVYLFSLMNNGSVLYDLLCFDKARILQGQVWRLFTYVFTYTIGGNPLLIIVSLVCYYSLGRAIENVWGTFRFNLFYLGGVLLMDIFAMLFCPTDVTAFLSGGETILYAPEAFQYYYSERMVYYLNLVLLISYATMYPDARFLILYVIPVKAWILGLLYLILNVIEIFNLCYPVFLFPHCLFPLVAFGNYILFFGKDVLNLVPLSWQVNLRRLFRKKPKTAKKEPIQFRTGNYQADHATVRAPYTHRCTVCGRTDTENPELEFRYCSRCNGYYCYCQDHISNHTHIQ